MNSALLHAYWLVSIFLPPTRCFALKALLLRLAGANVSSKARITSSTRFLINGVLRIDEGVFIGHECLFAGGEGEIHIARNCDIAPRVTLVTGTHRINALGQRVAGEGYSLPIFIGEGSWLCTGATILGGTTIGERSIVAAGAVVKGDFPANCLIGGVPARVLRKSLVGGLDGLE